MRNPVLLVSCADRLGLVNAITGVLLLRCVNIVNNQEFVGVTDCASLESELRDILPARAKVHTWLPARRRVAGNLDGQEAARLADEISAGIAIPHHFDLFDFNTASPHDFVAEYRRLGQPSQVLENGKGQDL